MIFYFLKAFCGTFPVRDLEIKGSSQTTESCALAE